MHMPLKSNYVLTEEAIGTQSATIEGPSLQLRYSTLSTPTAYILMP